MLAKLLWKFSQKINGHSTDLTVGWHKRSSSSRLEGFMKADLQSLPQPPMAATIEDLAVKAFQLGELPLWEGFEKLEDYPFPVKNATRNANQVRVDQKIGNLFFNLAAAMKPERIVEIGTAFGVSGMYWLSGIKAAGKGTLLTFEPNAIWAKVAESNLRMISPDFKLTVSTFEETHSQVLSKGDTIDMAFIDAIHTGSIVKNQFNLIAEYCQSGSLILFDDINFSYDMWSCWEAIANSSRAKASCWVARRLGIVELNG